jgi:hypothetical protein
MKHTIRIIILLIALIIGGSGDSWAITEADIIINVQPSKSAGAVNVTGISGMTVTITAVPATGYMIDENHILVEKMVDATRGLTAGLDVTSNGGNSYSFTIPEGYDGAYVTATFYKVSEGFTGITSLTEITDLNGSYQLTADVNAAGFESLGNFMGTLDGGFHKIYNLSEPLFTSTSGSAVIRNIIFEDVSISTSGDAGAVTANAGGSTRIYNCGILSSSTERDNDGIITGFSGSTVSGTGNVGGLVGTLSGNARVINCYSYANITGGNIVAGIVGNIGYAENGTITQSTVDTKGMVVNCMFYGDITGGTYKYPVYGGATGAMIKNDADNGVNPYCYYRKNAKFDDSYGDIADYKRSWPAEEKNLTRFEYYRSILNSNRHLCTYWATNKAYALQTDADTALIAKWVLDPTIAPYPILKKWGKYPSVINKDPVYRYNPETRTKELRSGANEWEGKRLRAISVTVDAGGHHAGTGSTSKTLTNVPVLDMDTLNCDYAYAKIQLPYYNEVFGDPSVVIPVPSADDYISKWDQRYGGNYKEYVVTGWDVSGGNAATNYNFADRNSYSGRVFAQGGYFYVPEGVSSITITAHWGKAVYLSNRGNSIDRVKVTAGTTYKTDMPFTPAGTISQKFGTSDNIFKPAGDACTIWGDLQDAIKALQEKSTTFPTVYDQAIVLVGNHQVKNGSNYNNNYQASDVSYALDSKWHPFTMMSADFDIDDEPDFCLQLQFRRDVDRPGIQPIRFDFLPVIELGLAVRHDNKAYAIGIMVPQGHFEVTETAFMRTTQFEYDGFQKTSSTARIESKSPVILNGGEFEMFTVRYHDSNRTSYFLLGGNVWVHRFAPGAHPNLGDKPNIYLCPINVIGGQIKEFYLSGLYRPELAVPNNQGNPYCFTDGAKFDIMAGAGYEKVRGGVTFKINHSKISEFYGGGINGTNPIGGNIDVTINNSIVDKYCGGPKVGNMSGKTVTTHATGTTFGVFYGGGNGGNSYYRQLQRDGDYASSHIGTWTSDNYNWNGFIPLATHYDDGSEEPINDQEANKTRKIYNKGYHAEYEFEVFNHSNGVTDQITQRGFIKWIQFGITTTGDVENELDNCTVLNNFYGGGNLASVSGNVTSTLTNTKVNGSVFGAGYSAAIPTFQVHDKGSKVFPSLDKAGTVVDGYIPYAPTVYEWTNKLDGDHDEAYMKEHPTYEKDGKNYCYTWNSLENLGTVTGNVTLTIDGKTVEGEDGKVMTVGKSVYGGGEESGVDGDTEVSITGGTIGTTGKGGAEYGNVYGGGKGKADDVTAGIVKGSTNVSISGSPTILHNVYGGGAYGSVGEFTYDATTGLPTGRVESTTGGKAEVIITGGTIGTTGDNNGMVFGSSRGLEANPEDPNVDKMAWVYDTDVTIGTQSSETGPSIKGSVYGGGENGHNFHDAKVTVHSGTIGIAEGAEIIDDRGTPGDTSDDISYTGARFPNRGNVYGSGCGTDTYTGTDSKTYFDFNAGIVRGNTTVLIDGGHVVHNVYGGGAMGSVGTYTFDVNGKPISCADETGTCTVTVSGGQIGVTGAKMAGYGKGGPDDFGHVFGAGRGEMHDPDQYPNMETCAFFNKTILNITGTAFLTGSVYGGSESGHVLGDTDVNISGGQIGCGKNATEPYGTDVWADDYIPTGESMDCASWPFTAPFAPYDPFANATGNLDQYPNGKSTDGGRLEASDGHTYYGNVFGGGSGSVPYFDTTEGISKYLSTAGSVEGKTKVTITGGHIITNVYGGCEATNVKGSATIKMTGGTVGVPRTVAQIVAHPLTGYIFGAGKGDQRIFFNKETNVDRTFVNIEGGRVYGSIFGGGEDGHVFQNTTVNIGKTGEAGPTIGTWGTSYVDGNVFGGGRGFGGDALTAGNIGGCVELNIKSGKILGSVYGGGRLASVGYGLYLVDEEITEDEKTIKPYGVLRPDNKYDGSYPNPSSDPATTYYNKGRGYIVINISGGTIGNDREYIYNPTADQKAAIPNTTFDYQNHLQYTKGGNVFTGGMGRLYALDNTTLLPLWPKLGKCKGTTLNMTGGTVKSSIYGGGEIGAVAENATVNVNGGTVGTKVVDPNDATKYYYFGSVFGGGKGSVDNITYPSTTPEEDKIPISEAGTTGGNVEVNLNKTVASNDDATGAIVSQVFGCNDMNGSPKGTVTVHVYATQNADKANISTKPTKGTDTYDVMAVYGGGNLAAYEPTDLNTGKAKVIIDGCGLTSVRQVYGGGNAASTPATDVEINGTYEIMELFGGGNGADKLPSGADNPGANVGYKDYHLVEDQYPTKEERVSGDDFAPYRYGTGEATVNIKGGTIHRVFGGSNTKGNVRKTALTMLEELQNNGEPVCQFQVDEAYGGGKSAPMDAEAKLHMACIPGLQEAYGGAEAADIHDNVTLTITNGTFNRVFGGNNISGTISGKITVNVEETGCRPVVIGELYGGGNLAAYSIYGYNDDGTPKESGDNPFDDPEVNVRSFTSIGAVYGGGYGTGAKMIASPTVNINESLGTPDTYPTTGDYDANGFKGKTITLDAGKETEHTVTLPAHTKGKMGAIGDVFGGGNAAEVKGNTTVNIGTLSENTFVSVDDDPDTTETDESKKPVLGADIRGNVYGGGNQAEVTGNTNVTIGKRQQ